MHGSPMSTISTDLTSSSDEHQDGIVYTPIYKLDTHDAYTEQEWFVILQHSISKRGQTTQHLQLTADHLSKSRLRASFQKGLPKSVKPFRAEIWKLLSGVQ